MSEFDAIAEEIDARIDEEPAKTTREFLDRLDNRTHEAIVYVGRMAAEISRARKHDGEARARLERIVDERLEKIEAMMVGLLETKSRVESMRPRVDSSMDLAKQAAASAAIVETIARDAQEMAKLIAAEIRASEKEELKALKAEGRDWGKWAVRIAVAAVGVVVSSLVGYLVARGGLP